MVSDVNLHPYTLGLSILSMFKSVSFVWTTFRFLELPPPANGLFPFTVYDMQPGYTFLITFNLLSIFDAGVNKFQDANEAPAKQDDGSAFDENAKANTWRDVLENFAIHVILQVRSKAGHRSWASNRINTGEIYQKLLTYNYGHMYITISYGIYSMCASLSSLLTLACRGRSRRIPTDSASDTRSG